MFFVEVSLMELNFHDYLLDELSKLRCDLYFLIGFYDQPW